MKQFLLIGIILVHGTPLLSQATCCEMRASSMEGSPAELSITIRNLNRSVVSIPITSAENDFQALVTSDAGQEASLSEYGRRLLRDG